VPRLRSLPARVSRRVAGAQRWRGERRGPRTRGVDLRRRLGARLRGRCREHVALRPSRHAIGCVPCRGRGSERAAVGERVGRVTPGCVPRTNERGQTLRPPPGVVRASIHEALVANVHLVVTPARCSTSAGPPDKAAREAGSISRYVAGEHQLLDSRPCWTLLRPRDPRSGSHSGACAEMPGPDWA
jgi:hypothetical protein